MLSSPGAIRRKQSLFVWAIIALTYVMVWLIPLFTSYHGSGDGTEYATRILRDPTQFKWYVIPLFIIVVNAYVDELRKKNYSGVLAGLAFFLMDAFNEIWNGLFHTATGKYAAVWQCGYPTAYEPLMGWNIEIIFMFLLLGLASTKLLPQDKEKLVFGKINNRIASAFVFAWICVMIEIILNLIGALRWNYWWWKPSFPWLIFIIGYWPFFMIAYAVYDMESRKKQIAVVGTMLALVVASFAIFVSLGWI